MGTDDALFDPMNEFPYIRRCIYDLPNGKPRTENDRIGGVPRLFVVPLRLGLVNATTGNDVTHAQLLLCRVKVRYCGHRCINGT